MGKPRRQFDRLLKSAAEKDPRGLLDAFGILPAATNAVVESLPREIITPVLEADHLYQVQSGARKWIEHIEFQAHFRKSVLERLAYYGLAALSKYKLPIHSTLALLDQKRAPRNIATRYVLQAGGVGLHFDFRVVRMWEIEASRLFDHPALLPLTFLARAGTTEVEEAAVRVANNADEAVAADFVVLGKTLYDEEYLRGLLRRHGMSIIGPIVPYEMIEKTDWWQDAERRGRVRGARRLLKRLLRTKFDGLDSITKLRSISDPDKLEAIFSLALETEDRARIEKAILKAATKLKTKK